MHRTISTARRAVSLPALVLAATSLCAPLAAHAVDVTDAWARSTVAGQTASGAFMTLKSDQPARVVGVSSPAAGVAQIHEMSMDGSTMRMHAVGALDLPAGKPVALKPGGYHVMLMDLNRPLVAGERLPLVLRIEGADHHVTEQTVSVDVRAPMDAPKP